MIDIFGILYVLVSSLSRKAEVLLSLYTIIEGFSFDRLMEISFSQLSLSLHLASSLNSMKVDIVVQYVCFYRGWEVGVI